MLGGQVAGVDSIAALAGPCYIKYMAAAAERSYCTTYSGHDRGILLQLGHAQVCICRRALRYHGHPTHGNNRAVMQVPTL